MLSNAIKFFITAASFSPLLLIYWVVVVIQRIQQYTCPLESKVIDKITSFFKSVILPDIYLLLIFVVIVLLLITTINYAKRKLTIRPISIDSIESTDSSNLPAILISYFLPALKLFPTVDENIVYLWGAIIILFVIALINKNSYNSNPVIWALGYRHYKVTANGISLMMLSKRKIINKSQITTYIQITDYLILDMSK